MAKTFTVSSIESPGADLAITANAGNLNLSASQTFVNGVGGVTQTMETLDFASTLLGAATVYNELNSSAVAAIGVISRLNIQSNALGTAIHSIIVGSPNPSGRVIWVQNVGTVGSITLFTNSGLGTVGGKFLGPRDTILIPGGGVAIGFDGGQNFWLIRTL